MRLVTRRDSVQYPGRMIGLLPLETLPGWPEAANPTVIEVLTVLLGLPLALAAVIVVIGMAPSWFSRGSSGSGVDVRRG